MPQAPGTFSKSKVGGLPQRNRGLPKQPRVTCELVKLDPDPDVELFWDRDGWLYSDAALEVPTGLRITRPIGKALLARS
jgi:hypothetical protein